MDYFSSFLNAFFGIVMLFGLFWISPCQADKYPLLNSIPETNFSCWQRSPGYYADPEEYSQCQVYHMCQAGGRMSSYLCPNHTLFDQDSLICNHWYKVNCTDIENRYKINDENLAESIAKIPNRKKNDSSVIRVPKTPKLVIPDDINFGAKAGNAENNGNRTGSHQRNTTLILPFEITTRPRLGGIRRINKALRVQDLPAPFTRIRQRLTTTTTEQPVIIKVKTVEEPDPRNDNSVFLISNECDGCLEFFMKDKVSCTPCVLPR